MFRELSRFRFFHPADRDRDGPDWAGRYCRTQEARLRQKPTKLLGPITEIVICAFVERANIYSYKMAARSSVKVPFSGKEYVGEYDIEGIMLLCSLMERAN